MSSIFNRSSSLGACLFCGSLLFGCAATTPKELSDARAAYKSASTGPAVQYSPDKLHTAETSLKLAEKSFEEDGDSPATRDLAYVATRRAQLADARARTKQEEEHLAAMKKEAARMKAAQLASAQRQLAEEAARRKSAEEELARLATVKQEERGTVITLSGSVLFASNKSELLPDAQQRLSEVARALNERNPSAEIVVEGHSDGKGSQNYNLELSAKRAEAVRNYLVSQGVAETRIRSQGLGFSHPISDNKTAEGRANNRRVEIVVGPNRSGS